MVLVAHHADVPRRVVVERDALVDFHRRELEPLTGELQVRLVDVVRVQMHDVPRPDELARLQAALLGHEHGQQRVAGDVEGHAQEQVGAALRQCAGELSILDVELEQRVAGRQLHLVEISDVPGRDDESPRVRVALNLVDDVGQLVDVAPIGCRPAAPLCAVDGTEVAVALRELVIVENALLELAKPLRPLLRVDVGNRQAVVGEVGLVGPLRPDAHAVLEQVADVGVALQEPDQLDDDPVEVHLLRRDEWEGRQVVSERPNELGVHPGVSAVILQITLLANLQQEVLVRCCKHMSPKNEACRVNTHWHLLYMV